MLIPPFTILVMILFGSLAHWKSLALAHKAMQPVKRAWEMNQESVLINIHELNDLVSRVQQKEETIQQLQSAITEIEQAKTVHITRIDHVATFIEHSDTVNTYYDTPAPATPPRVEECQLVEVPPEAAVHENLVFRKFLDGRPLNIEALYEWTAQHFLPRLGAKYEWFALFRVFSDSKLFESNMEKVSKFAEQMMLWYPGASYPCTASEVNRYKRGHLGQEPYKNWDKNVFRQQMKDKQSMDGFKRLDTLCRLLSDELDMESLKRR